MICNELNKVTSATQLYFGGNRTKFVSGENCLNHDLCKHYVINYYIVKSLFQVTNCRFSDSA